METTKMTPEVRKAAEEVLMTRWENELRGIGAARQTRNQLAKLAKMSDGQVWWALKNGA
jgi:hypothetical protein